MQDICADSGFLPVSAEPEVKREQNRGTTSTQSLSNLH